SREIPPVYVLFFFQAEDGIRDRNVTGVQTCALPISPTMMSRSASFICEKAGLMTYRPPMRATRTSEMGPPKGMSETASTAEAAKIGRASCRERVEGAQGAE